MLNWLSRYAPFLEPVGRGLPVLDVGSGPFGVGFWIGRPFVGVDLSFDGPPHPLNFAIRADAAALPFLDGAFDSVILADLLEHVAPERRPAVLKEALRVAARRVLITFPAGEAARRADSAFKRWHEAVFGAVPGWVEEHAAAGLPDPEEVAALLRRLAKAQNLDLRLEKAPGENVIFHLILTVFDHLPGLGREAVEAVRPELAAWARLCRQAAVGTPYRVNLSVELAGRPGPILKVLMAEPDLFKALACPRCRRGLIPEPEVLRCAYCGSAYRRDGAVWDLRPDQGAGRVRPDDPLAELKEYLGPEFDPDLFRDVAAKVDAEFSRFDDPREFYRWSRTYLYDLTLWDLSGAKAPGLRLVRGLTALDDPILDYGCGIGADGLRLMGLGYRQVAFADLDNPSTRYLRWRLERRRAQAPVYNIERDPIPRHRLVYSFDVIEHVPDPRAFLKTLEGLGEIVVVSFLLEPPDKRTDTAYPEYYAQVKKLIGGIRRGRCVLFDDTYRFEAAPGKHLKYRLLAWYSKPRPFLSVVICTRNRPEHLGRCLESLAAQSVSRRQFEVVVVDDGSDQFGEVRARVEGFKGRLKVRLVRQPHRGLAAARNRGIRAARGHVVLFLNDDVTLPPDGLAAHLRFHRDHPELWVGMLGRVEWAPELEINPIMDYVTGTGGQQFDFKGLVPGKEVDFWHFYGTCLSLKREFVIKNAEFFDPAFDYGWDDIEFGYRLARRGFKVYYRPEAVVYHHHPADTEYYVGRQRTCGRMAVVFARKHPELAPRLLPAVKHPAGGEVERLKAQVTLLEGAVVANPELKPTLEEAYGRLLWAAYLEGIREGLAAGRPIPEAARLTRQAEAALEAGRPGAALRILRSGRYGSPKARALYRLAAALAGNVKGLEPEARSEPLWAWLLGALWGQAQPEVTPVWLDGQAAAEYEEVFYLLFKRGRAEELDRVFPLAAWVWPDEDDRARALARVAARAGNLELAGALLTPLARSGRARPEDLAFLAGALAEAVRESA